ncbi:MAG: hypothetical protein ABI874_10465, partial [Chloroflexota bacterium]
LTLAWSVLIPREVVGDPSALRVESKEQYILLTAMAFVQDKDFDRARVRLSALDDVGIRVTVTQLAERYITELRPEAQRRSLAKLAVALGADTPTLRVYIVTPTVTPTPRASPTALTTATRLPPTITATPTMPPTPVVAPRVTYRLFEQVRLTCDQDKTPRARIVVSVQDAVGKGLPGVKVRVQWSDGQDTFFTGLKGSDPGYAEYDMLPGTSYSVLVADGTSQIAFGLDTDQLSPECPADGKEHFRAWRVVFRRVG